MNMHTFYGLFNCKNLFAIMQFLVRFLVQFLEFNYGILVDEWSDEQLLPNPIMSISEYAFIKTILFIRLTCCYQFDSIY